MRFLLVLLALALATGLAPRATAEDFLTTASGLQYAITAHGPGPQPRPGQVVVAHYVGRLADGTVFDSSRDKGVPYAFTLGKHQVIAGWDEAFALLHVGDQATLVVPPGLAYGARARGPIPANSTLRFEVELVAVKDGSLADALAEAIDHDGLEAARRKFAEWQADHFSRYYPDEGQLNALGYRYLAHNRLPEALAVLQWNVEHIPQSAKLYDSLGEAEVKHGDAASAITHYTRSLELDPKNANAEGMLAELKSSPGAIATMQARMKAEDDLNAAFEVQQKGEPVPLDDLRRQVVAVVAGNPAAAANGGLVNNFLYLSEAVSLQGAVQDWKLFAASPSPKVREIAESKLGLADALRAPLELKFRAADGRDVNLAKLRGKVVLVDFWATWCGPCVEEIPNVVATYEKFHDQGFEIVGISFDQAPDAAHPAKRQKTADEMLAFTQDHRMPWPQYYDGLYWKNPFGQRFGIRAIPAMFLLDKAGMIVSTNARGAKLGAEIERLLAAP